MQPVCFGFCLIWRASTVTDDTVESDINNKLIQFSILTLQNDMVTCILFYNFILFFAWFYFCN